VSLVVSPLALKGAPSPSETARAPRGTIDWKPCGGGFECATLSAPIDYSLPTGDTVGIALRRLRATGPGPHLGSLVVNFGGPGDAGTRTLRSFVYEVPREIRARFDLVSFDPRGTGKSRPIDCIDDTEADVLAAADPTADDVEQLRKFYDGTGFPVDLYQSCIDRNGSWLAQVGTRNVARDLERLRAGLGTRRLDFLGFSYGTVIGAVYAQLFPQHVGRFVLDGPVDLSATAQRELEADGSGFETALDHFLAHCARQRRCAFHSVGHPQRALEGLQRKFESGMTLPADQPSRARRTRPDVGAGIFYTALISGLYDKQYGWPSLADALAQAVRGDGTGLQSLADSYNGRNENGNYDSTAEVIGIILCDDRFDPVPSYDAFVAEYDRLVAVEPFLGRLDGSIPLGCDPRLPRPPDSEQVGDVRVSNIPPVLIVGTTGDPATPYEGAEDTQARLSGSRLLTFVSTEHTAYAKSRCVDNAVDAYLLRGDLPRDGKRCH
jgi:pimeloyl-ACP methyl ester carboxylesterase